MQPVGSHLNKNASFLLDRAFRRSVSGVPGFAEHPHPVASKDFRDFDGGVTATHEFCADVAEAVDAVETRDVFDRTRLIVAHLGGKFDCFVGFNRFQIANEVRTETNVIDAHEALNIVELVDISRDSRRGREGPCYCPGGVLAAPSHEPVDRGYAKDAAGLGDALDNAVASIARIVIQRQDVRMRADDRPAGHANDVEAGLLAGMTAAIDQNAHVLHLADEVFTLDR